MTFLFTVIRFPFFDSEFLRFLVSFYLLTHPAVVGLNPICSEEVLILFSETTFVVAHQCPLSPSLVGHITISSRIGLSTLTASLHLRQYP